MIGECCQWFEGRPATFKPVRDAGGIQRSSGGVSPVIVSEQFDGRPSCGSHHRDESDDGIVGDGVRRLDGDLGAAVRQDFVGGECHPQRFLPGSRQPDEMDQLADGAVDGTAVMVVEQFALVLRLAAQCRRGGRLKPLE